MERNIKQLVFLEFVDEAQKFLSRYESQLKAEAASFRIISFHPKVRFFLKSRGIEASDSYLFCPTSSHHALLEQLNDWTEQMRNSCTFKDAQGVCQSYAENMIFFTRPIVSSWLYRVEVLKNAINALKPEIVVCCGDEEIHTVQSVWTESCERYLTDILRQLQKKMGFELVCIEHDLSRECGKFNARTRLKNAAAAIVGLLGAFVRPRGSLILAPREDYSLTVVLKELREALPQDDIAVLLKPHKNIVGNFKEALSGRGTSFRYLFLNRMLHGL